MNNLMLRKNSVLPSLFDDDFFSAFDNLLGLRRAASAFQIDETEKDITYKMIIPGINKDNLKVDIKDNMLSVSYEQKGEEEGLISYHSFREEIRLHDHLDLEKTNAEYIDGVLQIKFAKDEDIKSLPRQITIK